MDIAKSNLHAGNRQASRGLGPAYLVDAHPLLAQLSPALRQLVVHSGTFRRHPRRGLLFLCGQLASGVHFLLEGVVQLEVPPPGGRPRGFVQAMAQAPAILSSSGLSPGTRWSATALALESTTSVEIDFRVMDRLLLEAPFAAALCRALWERQQSADQIWARQQLASPRERLARYLLSHVESMHRALVPSPFTVRLRQDELARAAAMSRETTNRLLQEFGQAGCLNRLARGELTVNPSRLRAQHPEAAEQLLLWPRLGTV